jgi:transcriptional regulator GlxA family with amidase domain
MLDTGIGDIEDIARACGFSNLPRFIRDYQQRYGLSPFQGAATRKNRSRMMQCFIKIAPIGP